jgi:hypothetical protein
MVEPIVIKSNYPKVGLVTIELGNKTKELSADIFDKLKPKVSTKEEYHKSLRIKIEELFNNGR